MLRKYNKKGFSLVELLVVITIIAILSVVAYMALGGQTAKARNSRRVQDLGTIQSALEIYYIENGNTYPTSLDDGDAIAPELDLVPKYMPKMAHDPSSAGDYTYVVDGTKKSYLLSATLETEASPFFEAYVTGNGTFAFNGVQASDGVTECTPVTDGGSCIPYKL